MSCLSRSDPTGIIFGILIILALIFVGWFLFWDNVNNEFGKTAIIHAEENYLPYVTCDVGRFTAEHGDLINVSNSRQLVYEKTSYFTAQFKDSNEMLFKLNGDTCWVVEDVNEAIGVKQMYLYSDQIQKFGTNFFEEMRWCTKRAAGADRVCGLTSTISNFFGNPFVNVVSYVPESVFDSVSSNLKKEGWEIAGQLVKGTRFVKKIAGSTVITVTIDLIKDTSCSLANPYQLGIFNESNLVNQTYLDARKRIFYQNTIRDIELANKSIIVYSELDKKNPNLFNSIIYSINDSIHGDNYCINYKYGENAAAFNADLNYIVYTAEPWVNGYLVSLNSQKISALSDLNEVSQAKSKNYTWDKWIPIQKLLEYNGYADKSKVAFDMQLYGSVPELAQEDLNFHNTFWTQVNVFDYIIGAIIWIIAIAIILIIGYFLLMFLIDSSGGGYYVG